MLAIVGLGFLALAMAAAAFVVSDVLYETTWAAVIAAGIIALLAAFWFVLPLMSRMRGSP